MKRIAPVLLLVLCSCRQTIQHGLDEVQANEIETLLHEAGIDARKARDAGRDPRWAIEVREEDAAAALKLLNDHGLPRERAPGFGEVFGKGSIVPTAIEENALFLHALSGELSRTLSSLDGVVSARVHVVAAPAGPPSSLRPPPRPRASVLLKVRAARLDALSAQKAEIQALVAGSVDGLAQESVSVMLSALPRAPAVGHARTRAPLALPLVLAGALVAALSGALALAFLRARRLRRQLAEEGAPVALADAGEPPPALPAQAR